MPRLIAHSYGRWIAWDIKIHFFEKDVPYYSSRRDFDSCDYCELTLYSDWASIRDKALSAAADSDVVITASFLPEGQRINDEILEFARPLRVFYDLDTPVTLNNLRLGEVEYLGRTRFPTLTWFFHLPAERQSLSWSRNMVRGWCVRYMAALIPTIIIA